MHYVYILESVTDPGHFYVGLTANVERRLQNHNAGGSTHTAKYRPWKLSTFIGFSDRAKARRFERYLKSGSGRAFSKKHF